MRSRLRAPSLRLSLAAVVFVVMLGIRIGPIPDDDDDPIVDYGPQLTSPLPARPIASLSEDVPPGPQSPGERSPAHHQAAHHFRLAPTHRKLHIPAQDPG
jgi:hypothetical protein